MSTANPPRRLRGACIGAGYFSRFHLEAWSRIPEVELVAVADQDAPRAAEAASAHAIPASFSSVTELLDRTRPDFVDIITPPSTHAAICAEAAARRTAIICQKPLGRSLDEARSIVACAADAGVPLIVHENFRFQPWHREIRRLLAAGAIGDRLHSLAFRSRLGDGWGPDAYLARQPYFRDYPRLLVYETGVHIIDTFRFLAGEITRVTAWLRRLNPVIRGEDCGLLVFEFASGAIGQWDANRFNAPPCPPADARYTFGELLVEGNAGSLRLHLDGRLTIQPLGEPERPVDYRHDRHGFGGDCVHTAQRHFTDCLLTGSPCETDGSLYLRTMSVHEAVYRSAETRSPVDL